MSDAIARVRRLLAAANDVWPRTVLDTEGPGGSKALECLTTLTRLAPALCDVIDAVCRARDAESGDESCRILREEVVLALDALDRAAEEASDG